MNKVIEFDINRDLKKPQPVPQEIYDFLIANSIHEMDLSQRVGFIHYFDEVDYSYDMANILDEFIIDNESVFFDAIIYGFYIAKPKVVSLGRGYYYKGQGIEGIILTRDRSRAMVFYDSDTVRNIREMFLDVMVEEIDEDEI